MLLSSLSVGGLSAIILSLSSLLEFRRRDGRGDLATVLLLAEVGGGGGLMRLRSRVWDGFDVLVVVVGVNPDRARRVGLRVDKELVSAPGERRAERKGRQEGRRERSAQISDWVLPPPPVENAPCVELSNPTFRKISLLILHAPSRRIIHPFNVRNLEVVDGRRLVIGEIKIVRSMLGSRGNARVGRWCRRRGSHVAVKGYWMRSSEGGGLEEGGKEGRQGGGRFDLFGWGERVMILDRALKI